MASGSLSSKAKTMSGLELLARCKASPDLFPALDDALAQVVGHRLFTLMAIDWKRNEAERIYSSRPKEYPLGGRKALGELTDWGEIVLISCKPWIARTIEDIRGAFFDHELIASLGCQSCLNIPVTSTDASGILRAVGTMNMLHENNHFGPEHVAKAMPFAALLEPVLSSWAAG